ncbi:MAG TPA: TerC family protein [Planctomycetota bacterium]|nr:TerC family protein [Planctomycetota bacterium]
MPTVHFLVQTPAPETPVSPWLWVGFGVMVVIVMVLDLGVFHRKAHRIGPREASIWVSVWITLAMLFNIVVWRWQGSQRGIEFLVGYLVEMCLSVDNLFVFVVIFTYFGVRPEHQHRVLFWGILGAAITRMLFIFVGFTAISRFAWLIYVFGAFLVYTGIKLLHHNPEVHPDKNIVLRVVRKFIPVTREFHGEHFFVKEAVLPPPEASTGAASGPLVATRPERLRLAATPLFLVLLVVETTDIVFAIDSVPAIMGVTDSSFIAFTSNIFAILGLRSMFFLLTGSLDKFHFLKFGLSIVLVFIGVKMLLHHWVDKWIPDKTTSALLSLLVVVVLLGGSMVLSLLFPPKRKPLEAESKISGEEQDSEDS